LQAIQEENSSIQQCLGIYFHRHQYINDAIQGSGPASFRIHGALHHLAGSLMPPDELQASYAQFYIYDPQEATDRCLQYNPQLDGAILLDLHTTFREINPYAPVYKQAYEIMRVSSYKLYYV
jgi:hypothetical protein